MFERLDDVDWAGITHAYGPAADVPDQLRGLASTDPEARRKARHALYGNIFHQGTRYEATAYAVPFLLELAADTAAPDRAELLALLTSIAVGYDESWLPGTFPIERWREQAAGGVELLAAAPHPGDLDYDDESEYRYTESLSDEEQVRLFRHIEVAAYDAVRAGVPLFRELLRSPDPELRTQAAYALAWFPQHAADSGPALLAAAQDRSGDPELTGAAATALVAAGLLGHRPPEDLLAAQEPLLCWAAAVGTACVCGADAPVEAIDDLLSWAGGSRMGDRRMPFLSGDLAGLAGLVLERSGPDRAQIFDALLRGIPAADGIQALPVVASALRMAFPELPVPVGRSFAELTPDQQRLLEVLASSPRTWQLGEHPFGNFLLMMGDSGLPHSHVLMRAYVDGEVGETGRPTSQAQ
ncbi:HEAT repeat domain-containing protein [Catellatospora citrea]|uniref:HEAT repeat domain-containing protein n=1 Tax=Catellatospora citrea TaxID=53366 RepID=UPI0033E354AE